MQISGEAPLAITHAAVPETADWNTVAWEYQMSTQANWGLVPVPGMQAVTWPSPSDGTAGECYFYMHPSCDATQSWFPPCYVEDEIQYPLGSEDALYQCSADPSWPIFTPEQNEEGHLAHEAKMQLMEAVKSVACNGTLSEKNVEERNLTEEARAQLLQAVLSVAPRDAIRSDYSDQKVVNVYEDCTTNASSDDGQISSLEPQAASDKDEKDKEAEEEEDELPMRIASSNSGVIKVRSNSSEPRSAEVSPSPAAETSSFSSTLCVKSPSEASTSELPSAQVSPFSSAETSTSSGTSLHATGLSSSSPPSRSLQWADVESETGGESVADVAEVESEVADFAEIKSEVADVAEHKSEEEVFEKPGFEETATVNLACDEPEESEDEWMKVPLRRRKKKAPRIAPKSPDTAQGWEERAPYYSSTWLSPRPPSRRARQSPLISARPPSNAQRAQQLVWARCDSTSPSGCVWSRREENPSGNRVATHEKRRSSTSAEGQQYQSSTRLSKSIEVGIEEEPGFRVCQRLIGPGGENVKHIVSASSGAHLRIRGHGVRHVEFADKTGPLAIYIDATSKSSFDIAVHLVEDLLDGVRDEYRQFCRDGGRPEPQFTEHHSTQIN